MAAESQQSLPGLTVLYREVKKHLIADIRSGHTPPGAALLNEREPARRFDMSIGTLRRAVEELVADHILVRQQGCGTFVGKLDEARFMYQFFKIEPREGAREFPVLKLHAFARARARPQEAAALLGLDAGTPVLCIERVAFTFDQKPTELRVSVVNTKDVDYVSRTRQQV